MAGEVKTGGGEQQCSPISMQADEAISDDLDEVCPECFGDDLIDLPNGNQFCRECRAVIDY